MSLCFLVHASSDLHVILGGVKQIGVEEAVVWKLVVLQRVVATVVSNVCVGDVLVKTASRVLLVMGSSNTHLEAGRASRACQRYTTKAQRSIVTVARTNTTIIGSVYLVFGVADIGILLQGYIVAVLSSSR